MIPLEDTVSDLGAVCGDELWQQDEQQDELIIPTDEPEQHGVIECVVEQQEEELQLVEQGRDVQSYALEEQQQLKPVDFIQQQELLIRQQGVLIQEQEQLIQQHNQDQYGQWQQANELLVQEQEELLIQQEDLLIHRQDLLVRQREQDSADHRQQQMLIRQQEQIIQQQELLILQQKQDNGDCRQLENDQEQMMAVDEEHMQRQIQATHEADATGLVDTDTQQLCLDVDREDMPWSPSPEPHQQHCFPTNEETVQEFRVKKLSIIGPEDRVDSSDQESVLAKDGSLESCGGKSGPPEPVRPADPFPMYESHVYDGLYQKVYTDQECRSTSPPEGVSVADVTSAATGGPDSVLAGHQPTENAGDVAAKEEECADASCKYEEGKHSPCQPLDLSQVMSADIGQRTSDEQLHWVIKQKVYPVDRSDLSQDPTTHKDNRWSL